MSSDVDVTHNQTFHVLLMELELRLLNIGAAARQNLITHEEAAVMRKTEIYNYYARIGCVGYHMGERV